ncbi:SH3 domain-containing protein [Clostridium algoriphilum]|uniref:VgrG-related protein n=1 Tax=Clostridium algoriphilum TaxID=198347 RepID=UPI001CF1018C|nr:SH3 domain-containing protein [Clostridium algoriphilum]MCB2293592.1 SH3 domain-containing protein [Clostridium algoriphilum]
MKHIFKATAFSILFYILISNSSQTFAKEVYLDEDLNKDGIVNILDLSLIASKYNTNYTLYDLNKDSIVDIYDLTKVSKSFDKTSYGLGIVTGEYINLRSTPNQDNTSNIVTKLYQFERFNILDDLGEWYKVRYNDNGTLRIGYAYALYTVPLRDNCFNSYLGFISSKNESTISDANNNPISVRDPGTISNNAGDVGGKSYGQYQLSSSVGALDNFITWLKTNSDGIDFYNKLNNAKIADGNKFNTNFDLAWKAIATDNFNEFFEFQRKFVKIEYYDTAVSILKINNSFDISTKSFALKEVLWSTAVQYGVQGNGTTTFGAVDIFREAGLTLQEDELITKIYDLKIEHAESITDDTIKNILITRATSEYNDVIYMYNSLH